MKLPLIVLASFFTLTTGAFAQNVIHGGPGHDNLVGGYVNGDINGVSLGTTEDMIFDNDAQSGGDVDHLTDDFHEGDGKKDTLNSQDGDNLDTMEGGPEDVFIGDDEDVVKIWLNGDIIWQGSYKQYKKLRRTIRWLRAWLYYFFNPMPEHPWGLAQQWFLGLAANLPSPGTTVCVASYLDPSVPQGPLPGPLEVPGFGDISEIFPCEPDDLPITDDCMTAAELEEVFLDVAEVMGGFAGAVEPAEVEG